MTDLERAVTQLWCEWTGDGREFAVVLETIAAQARRSAVALDLLRLGTDREPFDQLLAEIEAERG